MVSYWSSINHGVLLVFHNLSWSLIGHPLLTVFYWSSSSSSGPRPPELRSRTSSSSSMQPCSTKIYMVTVYFKQNTYLKKPSNCIPATGHVILSMINKCNALANCLINVSFSKSIPQAFHHLLSSQFLPNHVLKSNFHFHLLMVYVH